MPVIADPYTGSGSLVGHVSTNGQVWVGTPDADHVLSGGLLTIGTPGGETTELITDPTLDQDRLIVGHEAWHADAVSAECSFLFYCPGGGSGDYVLALFGCGGAFTDVDLWDRTSGGYTNHSDIIAASNHRWTTGATMKIEIRLGGGEGHVYRDDIYVTHFIIPESVIAARAGNDYIGIRANHGTGQEAGGSTYDNFYADVWAA